MSATARKPGQNVIPATKKTMLTGTKEKVIASAKKKANILTTIVTNAMTAKAWSIKASAYLARTTAIAGTTHYNFAFAVTHTRLQS